MLLVAMLLLSPVAEATDSDQHGGDGLFRRSGGDGLFRRSLQGGLPSAEPHFVRGDYEERHVHTFIPARGGRTDFYPLLPDHFDPIDSTTRRRDIPEDHYIAVCDFMERGHHSGHFVSFGLQAGHLSGKNHDLWMEHRADSGRVVLPHSSGVDPTQPGVYVLVGADGHTGNCRCYT
jgi:hypothetical protein